MSKRKFRGELIEDLRSYGAALANEAPEHKKGDTVNVLKKRIYGADNLPTKYYEYHYTSLKGGKLVRDSRFLIIEKIKKNE